MSVFGMWMWPDSVLERGVENVIAYCARAKVTDLFFLTKGLSGKTAYLSRYAPCFCERDLLREVIETAPSKGIRVHAWFTSASDASYKQLHPESGRCHLTRGKDRELISLVDEGYLSYMEKIIREICSGYDIDGLHLDYIRYNHLLYGWAEEDLARYAAGGADTEHLKQLMQRAFYGDNKEEDLLFQAFRDGDESVCALAHVRRNDVRRFARRLITAAREERNGLVVSAALMPEGAYDDTMFADLHYGQNYEDAAELYDYVLPMAYSEAYEQNAAWVRSVAQSATKRGLRTIVGLHAYDGGTGLTLQRDIASLEGVQVHGKCLFREGAFVYAFAKQNELSIYNSLKEEISGILVSDGAQTVSLQDTLLPGQAKKYSLPSCVKTVQVFAQQKECCVYLVDESDEADAVS